MCKLSDMEKKCSTCDQKLAATYKAVQQFKHLLEARDFTGYTDHKPLTYALSGRLNTHSPRFACHFSYISAFMSDIQHVWQEANKVHDTLPKGMNGIMLPHTSLSYTKIAKDQL